MAAQLRPRATSVLIHPNAVTRLRQQCLEEATREFNARGKSVVRCEECMLAVSACICAYKPSLQSKSEFVLLMHRNEVFKPTNTGRLIADLLADQTHAYCWKRKEVNRHLQDLLAAPDRQCVIVYPDEESKCLPTQELMHRDKKATFILLDGTWKQARRMLSLSRWLDNTPRLALPESLLKSYAVRKSLHPHQLSTAEAGALCLQLMGEEEQAEALLDYFTIFNHHYLATRGSYLPQPHALHEKLATETGATNRA